jgi:hypothetical protein
MGRHGVHLAQSLWIARKSPKMSDTFQRWLVRTVLLTGIPGVGLVSSASTSQVPIPVTFCRNVLPILRQRCQACHRRGEIAPIALKTYRLAAPRFRLVPFTESL